MVAHQRYPRRLPLGPGGRLLGEVAKDGVEAWKSCFGEYPTLISARIRFTPSASPAEPCAMTSGFSAAIAEAMASKLTVSGG